MRFLLLFTFSILMGCSSCSNGSGSSPDAGTDTGTGTSGDTDSDTDSDIDTDTDTDTDTFISDAGPWEWTDLPDSGDCGADCVQLTYSDEVRVLEWDVWGDFLVFVEQDMRSVLIDIENRKQLIIPSIHPEHPIWPGSATYYPTLYENRAYYSYKQYVQSPRFSEMIMLDWSAKAQTVVFHYEEQGGQYPDPSKYTDSFGDRIVSMGGCGGYDTNDLCHFPLPPPSTPEVIIPGTYGGHNSIWGDVVVWDTNDMLGDDIRGYDFSTQQFIEITDDAECQMFARIHGDRVVYQDLKLGTSDSMGDWNHAAIFMYEISTGTTTQITSGAWIAAYPDVHDNIIVWADYRDSVNPNNNTSFAGVQIWGYNIDTSTEFQITNILNRPKTMPRIWGDKVFVDMAKTTGGNAIYMFDLP